MSVKLKAALIYLGAVAMVFYGMPVLMQDRGPGTLALTLVTPAACLVISCLYGMDNGFWWAYPLFVALLFAPAVWIFYDMTAAVYIAAYGAAALAGNFAGAWFTKRKERAEKKENKE